MLHKPVLISHITKLLDVKPQGIYIDCTFGAGGYSKAILEANNNCKLIAIDQDPNTKSTADIFKEIYKERFSFVNDNFVNLPNITKEKIDGIVMDIGVSSMQIDNANRGFSFAKDGPLDMRMSCNGTKASDIINKMPEQELANIIYRYGGERKSRQIARKINNIRAEKDITSTKELADIVRSVVPKAKDKIDPATRTFQAIRIYINDELKNLELALESAANMLNEDGILIVVSFHSLEDRIVKDFFNKKTGKNIGRSRHLPFNESKEIYYFTAITKKAISPDETELEYNIRSRSAKLRAIKRKSHE